MSERNFCERCGKRIAQNEWDIHTCTPPAPKRPQNCGTGHCSCIECVMEPAQHKPLTDEQIIKCWGQVGGVRHGYVAFARAIEAAHNIKENT